MKKEKRMINKIYLHGKEFSGDEMVNAEVVAIMTGLSKRTIEDMTSRRELPMYKLATRANRYKVREIMEWLGARKIS